LQSLTWYKRRLVAMSPREVWWRIKSKAREPFDRSTAPLRRRLIQVRSNHCQYDSSCAIQHQAIGKYFPKTGNADAPPGWIEAWQSRLLKKAEQIRHHHITLFDLTDHDLGAEIDWNYEYQANQKTPMAFAASIDYRDFAVTGDCKYVWELNRHHQLVPLSRAYRITGQDRFAEEVVRQIFGWIEQCPLGSGMNWRSPLELAIRLINWSYALELIRPSQLLSGSRTRQIATTVDYHLRSITHHYSHYSSANNHLIGEAAGVFIASSYFVSLHKTPFYRLQSKEILLQEIHNQIYRDGGSREQAIGYHLFVLELFLLAGLVARNTDNDFPKDYWDRLEKMLEFTGALSEGGNHLPMFGDCDDGYVLDLGDKDDKARSLLGLGAVIFRRNDFKAWSKRCRESIFWLLGKEGIDRYQQMDIAKSQELNRSRSFPKTGYYLLQSGKYGEPDQISVTFDCGELGLGTLAAHGHADALSFTLRAGGEDIFVDSGTYDYFTYPQWRKYFRGTRAHNTVTIDDADQSEMQELFLWGRKAQARCLRWEPNPNGGKVVGIHDGYTNIPGFVRHSRSISLNGGESRVLVEDMIIGTGQHRASLYFHLAETCKIHRDCHRHNKFIIKFPGGTAQIEFDPSLSIKLFQGSICPMLGWISRGYHQKSPCTTVVAQKEWKNILTLNTRIEISTHQDKIPSDDSRKHYIN